MRQESRPVLMLKDHWQAQAHLLKNGNFMEFKISSYLLLLNDQQKEGK